MKCRVLRCLCLSTLFLGLMSGCQTAGKTARIDQPRSQAVQLAAGDRGTNTDITAAVDEQALEASPGDTPVESNATSENGTSSEPKRGWAKWSSNPLSQWIPQTARTEDETHEGEMAGRELF